MAAEPQAVEPVTGVVGAPDYPPKAWQLDAWPDERRGRLRR
jgi:hypothetical protein